MELPGRVRQPGGRDHVDRPVLRQASVQRPPARRSGERRLDLGGQGQHRTLLLAGRHRRRLLPPERGRRPSADAQTQQGLEHHHLHEEAADDGLETERKLDALLVVLIDEIVSEVNVSSCEKIAEHCVV